MAIDEMLAGAERRKQLHRLIAGLLGHGDDVLGRWAESLDRSSFRVAFRIVSRDWWRTQLPERPRTGENLPA